MVRQFDRLAAHHDVLVSLGVRISSRRRLVEGLAALADMMPFYRNRTLYTGSEIVYGILHILS